MEIGLALSGGGVRAAVFHLGVIRRIADDGLLERVTAVSTVSGGSLMMACVITQSSMKWPTSEEYLSEVYGAIRTRLTTTDLFSHSAIGLTGIFWYSWRLLCRRAEILVDLLKRQWAVTGDLRDLPERPLWYINTTSFETGKNWRFSKREMGDWKFGKHFNPPYSIAQAVAASAAVPYAIGTLEFPIPADGWFRTDPATGAALEKTVPARKSVRLWDGGAYENLGLEALFKPTEPLRHCDFLICSDASGPLSPPEASSPIDLLKGHLFSPRLFDIASDQIRSLRSRMFMNEVRSGGIRGAILRMGDSVRRIDIAAKRTRNAAGYDAFLPDIDVAQAFAHRTDLQALSPDDFDRIARHGYETADAVLTAYAPAEFATNKIWELKPLIPNERN